MELNEHFVFLHIAFLRLRRAIANNTVTQVLVYKVLCSCMSDTFGGGGVGFSCWRINMQADVLLAWHFMQGEAR